MDVRLVDLETLHPDPRNVRQHDALNIQAIAESLSAFGQQKPLVVTAEGLVLAGNGTLEAARTLGWTQINVHVTSLDEPTGLAYAVADNRTAELATWHAEALEATLRSLAARDQPLPGWSDADLRDILGHPAGAELHDVEPALDRATELLHKWAVEPGQLWRLGRHRVLCADALDPANLEQVLGGLTPQGVFCDPPYGVSIVTTTGWVGGGEAYQIPFGGVRKGLVGGGEAYRARPGEWAMSRDQRQKRGDHRRRTPTAGTVGTHDARLAEVGKYAPVLGDDSPATARTLARLLLERYPTAVQVWWGGNYYTDALTPSACWLVWDKETTGHFADCELAWVNQPKAARLFRHRWNGMLRASERERRWHPTQKPSALAAWVFETVQKDVEVILDPCLGCGPTLVAGEQRGKTVGALELSPAYVAVILERWHQLSGAIPTCEPAAEFSDHGK